MRVTIISHRTLYGVAAIIMILLGLVIAVVTARGSGLESHLPFTEGNYWVYDGAGSGPGSVGSLPHTSEASSPHVTSPHVTVTHFAP